jgi:hypothetical protein
MQAHGNMRLYSIYSSVRRKFVRDETNSGSVTVGSRDNNNVLFGCADESLNGADVLKAKSRVKGDVLGLGLGLGTNMSSSSENALCLCIVLSSDWSFSQDSNMADPEELDTGLLLEGT